MDEAQLPPGFQLDHGGGDDHPPEGFVVDQPMGFGEAVRGFSRSIGQGALFGMGDELEAAIKAPILAMRSREMGLPEAYDYALNKERQKLAEYADEHPVLNFAGNVTGAVGTGIAGARALPAAAREIRDFAGKSGLHALAAASGLGAASGGVYGFGVGEGGAEERIEGAKSGGIAGGFAGPAGLVVGKAARPVIERAGPLTKKVLNKLSKKKTASQPATVADIAEGVEQQLAPDPQFDESAAAFAKVRNKLQEDFPDNLDAALQAYKDGPEALIELYGNKTRSLAKGAAQYPSGKASADRYFDQRTGEAVEGMKKAVSQNISPVENYFATADDVLERGRERVKPLYKEAFKANPSMSSPRLDRILNTPEAKEALATVSRYYQDQMKLLAKPDPELTEIARELARMGKMDPVKGGVASGIKMEALDAVKKELDAKVRGAKRAMDMGDSSAVEKFRAFEAVRSNLVDEIDNLDVTKKAGPNSERPKGGLYKQARAGAGDYIRVEQAMDEGRNFHKLDPELIGKRMDELAESEKEAFKIGVGKRIRDIIDDKNEGANPFNAVFGKGRQKQRLEKILGPDEYRSLEKSLRAEDRIFKMRNEILGGSPTMGKAVAAAEIAAGGADALATMASGGIQAVPRQAAVGFIRKMFDGLSDKTAGKVSDILYERDPVKKLMILEKLNSKAAGLTVREQAIVKRAYFATESILKNAKQIGSGAAGAAQGLRVTVKPAEGMIPMSREDFESGETLQ